MIKMTKLTLRTAKSLALTVFALGVASCSSDEPATSYIELSVQLELDSLSKQTASSLANRTVTLTTSNGRSVTANTNADGIATFTQLIPGNYSVSSSWDATEGSLLTGTLANTLYTATDKKTLSLTLAPKSDLVISKVYYSGGKNNAARNTRDAIYIELLNNSAQPINLKDYSLALSESNSTYPEAYKKEKPQKVFAKQLYDFPESYTLAPGAAVVIVNQSINHKLTASNDPDLSNADFEVADPQKKISGQTNIPDMGVVYTSFPKLNMNLTVGPASLMVLKTKGEAGAWPKLGKNGTTTEIEENTSLTIPTSTIVDAVDILAANRNGVNIATKRFPTFVDAGYTSVPANNAHWVVARKVVAKTPRVILQDTNNSSNDFVAVQSLAPRSYDYPSSSN